MAWRGFASFVFCALGAGFAPAATAQRASAECKSPRHVVQLLPNSPPPPGTVVRPRADLAHYQACDVDVPAVLKLSRPPEYPPTLASAAVEGDVLADVRVLADGRVDMKNVLLVRQSTHELFTTAVRRALLASRNRAARRDGLRPLPPLR